MFKTTKILLCFGLSTLSMLSYSQQQVIKCTTSDGRVVYHNGKENTKGMSCNNTNLANIDKRSTPVSVVHNINSANSSNTGRNDSSEKVSTYEQSIRNQKRVTLLSNELEQEKQQLNMAKEMRTKLPSKEEAQVKQYDEMIKTHQNNIETLEKEIKKSSPEPISLNKENKSSASTTGLTPSIIPGLAVSKSDNSSPSFEIEGLKVDGPPKSIPVKDDSKKNTTPTPTSNTPTMPSLDSMRESLQKLQENRDGETTDKSQHIETNRRTIPNMKVSQATINYMPLPTPLSVPDLNISRK